MQNVRPYGNVNIFRSGKSGFGSLEIEMEVLFTLICDEAVNRTHIKGLEPVVKVHALSPSSLPAPVVLGGADRGRMAQIGYR